jgi:hypothetical protein
MTTPSDEPENGKASFFDKIALFSAVVSLICVLAAHGMDHISKNGTLDALLSPHAQAGVDYTGTASIGKNTHNVILNPCQTR